MEVVDDAALNELNKQIVIELQGQGNVVMSGTALKGRCVMRARIINHRSHLEDFDFLVREVTRVSRELASKKNASFQ